jgi:hypothetical protein
VPFPISKLTINDSAAKVRWQFPPARRPDRIPNRCRSQRNRRALLSNYPINVFLLAMDLAAAKEFYTSKIGLPVLSETPDEVTFQCGGDTHLVLSKSTVGTKDDQTQAAFRVADVPPPTATPPHRQEPR